MESHLEKILAQVVEQAVDTGEPVGSQYLVDTYSLNVSSATVRNYFMDLEEQGLIMQPHTSSGRLPTEKGYQYFVEHLLVPRALSKKETNELSAAAKQADSELACVKACAKVAAELSQNAAIVGLGHMDSYYTGLTNLFSQHEFKDWNRVVSMSDVLDRLDDVLSTLRESRFEHPTTMIGSTCPFGPMCGSAIVTLPGGILLGLLGPMRMDYGLSISLAAKIQLLMTE